MDGDIVFINRPPSTHKHSPQALSVYIHDEHTVEINPLICNPLGADFDGDCIHLFYSQSLAAKAVVLELFSVEQRLLCSLCGKLNLQHGKRRIIVAINCVQEIVLKKATAPTSHVYVSSGLQFPALLKACGPVPQWTDLQILQNALPADLDCLVCSAVHSQLCLLKKGLATCAEGLQFLAAIMDGKHSVSLQVPSQLFVSSRRLFGRFHR